MELTAITTVQQAAKTGTGILSITHREFIDRTMCSLTFPAGDNVKEIPEPRYDKTNKTSVRPAKTQISLGIRPV